MLYVERQMILHDSAQHILQHINVSSLSHVLRQVSDKIGSLTNDAHLSLPTTFESYESSLDG